MKQIKYIATTILEYLIENKIEMIKNTDISVIDNKIEGGFLNKKQVEELQKEIESNYDDNQFNTKKDDIRLKLFNYDNPIVEKDVNGVNLRIVEGLTTFRGIYSQIMSNILIYSNYL